MSAVRELHRRILARDGLDVAECDAARWLDIALEADGMARACGPNDPGFAGLLAMARRYEMAACIAETDEVARRAG